jgi:hypothetical protein
VKRIDAEIAAVEQRIGAHKVALSYAADAAKQRAARKLKSPAMLGAGALVVGLLALKMVRGHRRAAEVPQRRSMDREQAKKGFALGTLLMTGATWLIRSQFGGPVGLAQFVLSKVREGRPAATVGPADSPPRLPR